MLSYLEQQVNSCHGSPIYAVLFGQILGVLEYTDTAQARADSVFYALYTVCGFTSK